MGGVLAIVLVAQPASRLLARHEDRERLDVDWRRREQLEDEMPGSSEVRRQRPIVGSRPRHR